MDVKVGIAFEHHDCCDMIASLPMFRALVILTATAAAFDCARSKRWWLAGVVDVDLSMPACEAR